MKKAQHVLHMDSGKVRCELCSHSCVIGPGRRGLCGVRENREGVLFSRVYGALVAEAADPVEKKPLFHFLPGSLTYSIATQGCNFHCRHCQNYQISQLYPGHDRIFTGRERTPEQVVEQARTLGCSSISYTYVEPTVFYEFAHDCAQLARMDGLANIFVSNGYMTPSVTRELSAVLDAINIDVKAFSDAFYRQVCGARLAPVLETVGLMHELGVWVEVTTLVIPGLNDREEEFRELARFIRGISPEIPWHLTAFRPTYRMTDRDSTPLATLEKACRIGLDEGLHFVYQGNLPGRGNEDTLCPNCGAVVVQRRGFVLTSCRLAEGRCPECSEKIAGHWMDAVSG